MCKAAHKETLSAHPQGILSAIRVTVKMVTVETADFVKFRLCAQLFGCRWLGSHRSSVSNFFTQRDHHRGGGGAKPNHESIQLPIRKVEPGPIDAYGTSLRRRGAVIRSRL